MNRGQKEGHIRKLCRDAGCNSEQSTRHRESYIKHGWEAHPPKVFADWWNPYGKDEPSGASVGGHPDATRVWARKDQGGWNRRTYGCSAEIAWNTDLYRNAYEAWVETGMPEREAYISIAVSLPEFKAHMARIEALLDLGDI